eukprot:CAMPEP_0197072758 /NCGR_PEP_ID=MMETSP1384-20130603/210261_1 /TAXON_ID=29189 /ORGANISM="Ammonia sp." /LENGTH=649 /DNA_ID=CAMNT_0042511579 /DNA_START=79 /DNA_END=2029 /DNA_ORIENTATION=-
MVISQSVSAVSTSMKRKSKSLSSFALNNLNYLNPRNISIKAILTETWLVSNLAIELAFALGSRLIWIWMFFRFLIYVSLLVAPFVRTGWVFMISDYIKRSVQYGPNPRNYLDIYTASDIMTRRRKKTERADASLPSLNHQQSSHRISTENKYPVVIFLSGGAWIIGYKAWGAFMGMLLAQLGVIFVSPDYRNFPQGTISDMVTDATNAVQWAQENIHKYGGDKNKMYVISQSAGAHIGALMMLMQARKVEVYRKLKAYLVELKYYKKQSKMYNKNRHHIDNEEDRTLNKVIERVEDKLMSDEYNALWDPQTDLKAFIGIAGPYNLQDMKYYLDQRGLYSDIIDKIMEDDLRKASPFYCLYDLFISPHDNKRKLKPLDRISSITDTSKPFVSMTEIEVDEDVLSGNYDEYDVHDEQKEGSTKSSILLFDDLFISPHDNKRKLKPLDRISSITDTSKPFVSMTEIEVDGDVLSGNYDEYDVHDEQKEGSTKSQPTKSGKRKRKRKRKGKSKSNVLKEVEDDKEKEEEYECPSLDVDGLILNEKVELKLPAMYLFHGGKDLSCPVSNTKTFSVALANYGVKTFIKIYENKSHTAPIIEDPISGKDPLMCDMLQIIYPDQSLTNIVHEIEESVTGGLRIPQWVIDLASFVCPF